MVNTPELITISTMTVERIGVRGFIALCLLTLIGCAALATAQQQGGGMHSNIFVTAVMARARSRGLNRVASNAIPIMILPVWGCRYRGF